MNIQADQSRSTHRTKIRTLLRCYTWKGMATGKQIASRDVVTLTHRNIAAT
jgi:hypothetical protein